MVKIISHRGHRVGFQKGYELFANLPEYIDVAIGMDDLVEVDIRYKNNDFYLGHDEPTHKITFDWIRDRKKHLLLHCKDLQSAYRLCNLNEKLNYFTHQNDDFALISNGLIWVHNLNLKLNAKCIIPLINKIDIERFELRDNIWGICTDYVMLAKEKFGPK